MKQGDQSDPFPMSRKSQLLSSDAPANHGTIHDGLRMTTIQQQINVETHRYWTF